MIGPPAFVQAALRFTRGLLGMPLPWRVWLLALVLANFVVPLTMFSDRLEARIVIATFLAGAPP
ncbi:MAG: hypothetical protein HY271_01965 [Deltaproteobacteria bacterium]|nr:hypothetical protein [Deltaproteobacteria bacterium]